MSNKKQKITHCTENVIESQLQIMTFIHTFTLCGCAVCNVPHNPAQPVCEFENVRRKLSICSSKITDINCKGSFENFFQNNLIANTQFIKLVCNSLKIFTNHCFVENSSYELNISKFNESVFMGFVLSCGLTYLPLWFKNILTIRLNMTENISGKEVVTIVREKLKNHSLPSPNPLSRHEIYAVNTFVELLGSVIFMRVSSSAMSLIDIFEKANKTRRTLTNVIPNEIKNYIEECNAHTLVSWNVMSKSNNDGTTCVQFKYDFGNEYKMLLFDLCTLRFSIGEVIEKEIV